jgi:thymidylate synthase (FAD)
VNEPFEALTRPSVPALDARLGAPVNVLDHGFVRLIDYMGDEAAIVQAARVSYGKGTKTPSDDAGLLRYLLRHAHTTPFEMCEIKLHMKLPIFVARQWIRHRTANVNEYSARYSILDREFHIPDAADVAKQSTTNRQGRADGTGDMRPEEVRDIMRKAADRAFDDYELLVSDDEPGDFGLAREMAREVLPLSTYTQWYWKIDLHNLLHFLKLRTNPHAQKEIRVFADAVAEMVKVWVPNVFEAFDDYVLGAHTFSRKEMEIIADIISGHGFTAKHLSQIGGLSKREQMAFYDAVGVDKEER